MVQYVCDACEYVTEHDENEEVEFEGYCSYCGEELDEIQL